MNLEELESKKALVRFDYNVPMDNGEIVNDFRIRKSLQTIKMLLDNNNKIIIASHLGRPTEGEREKELSLEPICKYLSTVLNKRIKFFTNLSAVIDFEGYDVAMLENMRFNVGEKICDPKLSKTLASLADVFVFDAFGVSHRKECSTYGVADFIDVIPGLNIKHEITTINRLINEVSRPMTIIISGSKVSTKLALIRKLLNRCDNMILGGGILNTFLKAKGYEVGKSLTDSKFLNEAADILNSSLGSKIFLPSDYTCQTNHGVENISLSSISDTDTIYDLGIDSISEIKNIIEGSSSIFWNGPLGLVEKKPFDNGTKELAKAIARHNCFSIVGGGDTLPIIENLNLQDDYTCLSTGGGSLLTYLEGGSLPILEKLDI